MYFHEISTTIWWSPETNPKTNYPTTLAHSDGLQKTNLAHQTAVTVDKFIDRSSVIQISKVKAKCQTYHTESYSAHRIIGNQFIFAIPNDNVNMENYELIDNSSNNSGTTTNDVTIQSQWNNNWVDSINSTTVKSIICSINRFHVAVTRTIPSLHSNCHTR